MPARDRRRVGTAVGHPWSGTRGRVRHRSGLRRALGIARRRITTTTTSPIGSPSARDGSVASDGGSSAPYSRSMSLVVATDLHASAATAAGVSRPHLPDRVVADGQAGPDLVVPPDHLARSDLVGEI